MAIEAAAQTASLENPGGARPAFSLRNIFIKAALKIPDDNFGVETVLYLHPTLSVSTRKPRWSRFVVCSRPYGSKTWTEHCTGDVNVHDTRPEPFGQLQSDTDFYPSEIADWYDAFREIGLGFGPSFRRLKNLAVNSRCKEASADVQRLDGCGVEYPESSYPFHPTVLDACLQMGLIAAHKGDVLYLKGAFVPLSIKAMTLWNERSDFETESPLRCYSKSDFTGLRGLYGDIRVVSPSGKPALQIEGLRAISYANQPANKIRSKSTRNPYLHYSWKLDIDSLTNTAARQKFPPVVPLDQIDDFFTKSQLLTDCIILDISDQVVGIDILGVPRHLQQFLEWIERRKSSISSRFQTTRMDLLEDASSRRYVIQEKFSDLGWSVETQLLKRLYDSLADILVAKISPLQIALQDNLLSRMYSESIVTSVAQAQLCGVIDLLSHSNPNMKILEVGAGTGGATEHAMKALKARTAFARYRDYYFTDVTASFLSGAAERFSECHNMHFGKLDISSDPHSQGYENDFDLILAFQCLHATPSIKETLKNVRKLLKPGGRLLMLEGTRHLDIVSLIFGMFPDYWAGVGEGRVESAFYTRDQWSDVLIKSGFTGLDLCLDDVPKPHTCISLMMSQVLKLPKPVLADAETQNPQLCVVYLNELPEVGHHLTLALARKSINFDTIPLSDVRKSRHTRFICLMDLERSVLMSNSSHEFVLVQNLILCARSLLWLTGSVSSGEDDPSSSLIKGLLLCAGLELPALRYTTIDIDNSSLHRMSDELIEGIVLKERNLAQNFSTNSNELSYQIRGGLFYTGRYIPNEILNHQYRQREGHTTELEMQKLRHQPAIDLRFAQPGVIDSGYFKQSKLVSSALPTDYIEIETKAIGVEREVSQRFTKNTAYN